MNKEFSKILTVSIAVITLTILFCGCLGTEVEKKETNVFFESEVVNLLEHSLEFNRNNKKEINQVIVNGRIENKLNRKINVTINAEFYDKDDNYLGEKDFTIFGLRALDKPGDSTTFTITYEGEKTNLVHYSKLIVFEKE